MYTNPGMYDIKPQHSHILHCYNAFGVNQASLLLEVDNFCFTIKIASLYLYPYLMESGYILANT